MEKEFVIMSNPVLVKEGKLLLIKDDKGIFELPGAIVMEGETLEEACVRKLKESYREEVKIIRPLNPTISWENKKVTISVNYLAEFKDKSISNQGKLIVT